MSTIYTTRKNYFSSLAVADPNVQHEASYNDEDGNALTRNSFIEISGEQDNLGASVINGLNYPFVVQAGFTGGLSDRDGDIRNRFSNRLQFLTKAVITAQLPTLPAAIEAAKELTYKIMKAWINKMFYDMQENRCSGSFKNLDLNAFSWSAMERVADDFYGWELQFTDDMSAGDVIDYDTNYWQ